MIIEIVFEETLFHSVFHSLSYYKNEFEFNNVSSFAYMLLKFFIVPRGYLRKLCSRLSKIKSERSFLKENKF